MYVSVLSVDRLEVALVQPCDPTADLGLVHGICFQPRQSFVVYEKRKFLTCQVRMKFCDEVEDGVHFQLRSRSQSVVASASATCCHRGWVVERYSHCVLVLGAGYRLFLLHWHPYPTRIVLPYLALPKRLRLPELAFLSQRLPGASLPNGSGGSFPVVPA